METVLSAGAASVICGAAAYWLVLLEQWLWRGGAVKKTAALLRMSGFLFFGCACLADWHSGAQAV